MPTELAVETAGLNTSFGTNHVLRGVDLQVPTGSLFALLGPNGAGKTTTVRILSTLLRPDGGTVRVAGHDVVADPRAVRRAISLTGQFAAVDELLTGRENLNLMARLWHLDRSSRRRRCAELLEQFDLVDAADRAVKSYSGGMRRRLDLAIGLMGKPTVVFLDEPTTGLDPRSRRTMWDVVRGLLTDGVTVVLTTQYLEEADQLADRIAVIDGGRIVAEGTSAQLKNRVGSQRLDLSLPSHEAFAAAQRLFAADIVHRDPADTRLGISTDGSARHVHAVLDRCIDAGIDVTTVSIHQSSLDDVFLALTGAPATTTPEQEPTHV